MAKLGSVKTGANVRSKDSNELVSSIIAASVPKRLRVQMFNFFYESRFFRGQITCRKVQNWNLGVEIFSAQGEHRGLVTFPEQPANVAFAGADRKTMYVTARKGLYRVRMPIAGLKPH
ncbi:MAG: hypothetical protein MI861_15845 [Pirellulales bacterium]|nr:hypothetical protein [Pirellulales bacterium]